MLAGTGGRAENHSNVVTRRVRAQLSLDGKDVRYEHPRQCLGPARFGTELSVQTFGTLGLRVERGAAALGEGDTADCVRATVLVQHGAVPETFVYGTVVVMIWIGTPTGTSFYAWTDLVSLSSDSYSGSAEVFATQHHGSRHVVYSDAELTVEHPTPQERGDAEHAGKRRAATIAESLLQTVGSLGDGDYLIRESRLRSSESPDLFWDVVPLVDARFRAGP